MSTCRPAQQHAREEQLLLVAARQRARRRAGAVGAHRPALERLAGAPALGAAADEPVAAHAAQAGQGDVLGDRAPEQQPVLLARLGDHRQARAQPRPRAARQLVAGSHLDRARGRALGAEDRARELGAPGADEPGEGHDLAGADGEAHALHARSVQVAHGEDRRRVRGRGALGREGGRQRAAEHRVDERVLGLLGGGRRAHDAPVAQDRDLVGEREHLAQEVRDEQHGAARARRASGRSRAAGRSPRRRATAVGSSMTMSSASRASARRISTFCCSAGAQAPGGRRGGEVEAGRLGQLLVAAAQGAAGDEAGRRAARRRGRRSPRRVSWGTTLTSCAMAATPRSSASRGERSATSSPSSSSRPSSGASTPATIRPSVDLPAPFSPTSAWIDPRAMLSDTPSSARTAPKCLETSASSTWVRGWSPSPATPR